MVLRHIELRNFRNFENLSVRFHPGLNVLVGDNGQGKTNLIEALYLLGRGSSFRPATNHSLMRNQTPVAAWVRAQIEKDHLEFEVEMGISSHRKDWQVNGKKASSLSLEKHFPVVLFSPESLAVIKEGPEERRQFIDELLAALHPQNARAMADYRAVLNTRNRVLRDHRRGLTETKECQLLLASLAPNFLDAATRLTQARLHALEALSGNVGEAMRAITNTPTGDISVEYLISGQIANGWSREQIHAALHKKLDLVHLGELTSGVSLVGPHKHDIRVLVNGKDSRFYCSQGQQRALILSFKMARIVYHYRVHKDYPFLLLDDVLSELDEEKRANLVAFLKSLRAQIFITTTDFSLPNDLGEGQVFEVENGSIRSS